MEFIVLGILLYSLVILSEATNNHFGGMNISTNKLSLTRDIHNPILPSTPFTLSKTTAPDETSPEKMPRFKNVRQEKNFAAPPAPDSGFFSTETTTENGLLQTENGLLLSETTTVPTATDVLPNETTLATTGKSSLPTEMTTSLSTKIGSLPAKTTTVSTDMVLLTAKTALNPSKTRTPMSDYFLCSDYSPKSCSGHCGQAPEVGCACDEMCIVYNSCCDDYQDVCSKEANLANIKFQRLLNLNSTCERVLNQVTTGAQVISSCPSDYSLYPEIKQQCEKGNILFVPVTSRSLKLHFRSVYCMLCNGGQMSDGIFWTIAAAVYGNITTMFETHNEFTESIRGRTYFLPIYTQDVPLRHCFVEAAASSCIGNSKDISDACFASKENLVSLKKSSSHIIFKNIYCLKCSAQNQSSLDQLYCKYTQMHDLKGVKTPKYQFLVNWKTPVSFVVTHRLKYVWKEMECHINKPGSLQPFCQISKCNKITVLKNNKCHEGNTFSCFLYQFSLHLNLSEHLNDLDLVNNTLALFQFKLADTLSQTYSKTISTIFKENGVSGISIDSELDQVIAHIWVKLHGPPLCSYLQGKLNTEYFKFLNTALTDVRLNFSLCACPVYLRYDEYCQVKGFCSNDNIYICLGGSPGDDYPISGTYHRDVSHYLIFFMFVFKYISC